MNKRQRIRYRNKLLRERTQGFTHSEVAGMSCSIKGLLRLLQDRDSIENLERMSEFVDLVARPKAPISVTIFKGKSAKPVTHRYAPAAKDSRGKYAQNRKAP